MTQLSAARLRQRKLLLVLPLLIVPFLSIAFWALGGGKNSTSTTNGVATEGLNLDLPGAQFKGEKELNKMGYYEKAAHDSSRMRAAIKNDPYYDGSLAFPDDSIFFEDETNFLPEENLITRSRESSSSPSANAESRVYEKLQALQHAMQDAEPISPSSKRYQPDYSLPTASLQLQRLEQLIKQPRSDDETDPELDQLHSMLDKIKDIQHPELVKKRITATVEKEPSKALLVSNQLEADSLVDGFYPLIFTPGLVGSSTPGIRATIHESGTIVQGSVVRLRLQQDLYIGKVRIPSGTFVHGMTTIQQERVQLQVTGIVYDGQVYPVQLNAYDLDGLPGLYIPGIVLREVATAGTSNTMQSLGMMTLDPSLAAQAATAGINTAKSFLSKKVKIVRAHLKAGHQVLLQNKKLQ